MDKQDLRKWAKNIRSKLDIEALSDKLANTLKQTDEYKNAKNIMIFYPLKDEINFLKLLEDTSKTFYLPKISGENLLCCKFTKDTKLCESCFNTKEPDSLPENESILDLIIVPALVADKNNYRLGYGKGFYDKFLSKLQNVKTIVCIPHELIVETIYPNEQDIPVDLIITD